MRNRWRERERVHREKLKERESVRDRRKEYAREGGRKNARQTERN